MPKSKSKSKSKTVTEESPAIAFCWGLFLGSAIITGIAMGSGYNPHSRYVEPPYDPTRHLELTDPVFGRCRLSGPARFHVLDAAYPPKEPTPWN